MGGEKRAGEAVGIGPMYPGCIPGGRNPGVGIILVIGPPGGPIIPGPNMGGPPSGKGPRPNPGKGGVWLPKGEGGKGGKGEKEGKEEEDGGGGIPAKAPGSEKSDSEVVGAVPAAPLEASDDDVGAAGAN